MPKTILLTGASDGIGLETAKKLAVLGHHLIIHGRNKTKIESVKSKLMALPNVSRIDTVIADLSDLRQVTTFAKKIISDYTKLDILINNAGLFKVANPLTAEGLDVRFVVNTIAPYLLTQLLTPLLGKDGRVVNLSSAAQAPVNMQALIGDVRLEDMQAYAQSKLGIRLWSAAIALIEQAPTCISVNPGSLLASKMVKEGFGIDGNDLSIGADILVRVALDEEMLQHNGEYFDNDAGRFSADIHETELNRMAKQLVSTMDKMVEGYQV